MQVGRAGARDGLDSPGRTPARPINTHQQQRLLSALAYDRGEEYDPAMPVAPDLFEAMSLVEQARPVSGEDGRY